ncbi:MAG: glycerol-3-phosphate 1-O-acyltransferase PlsY [Candidatus Eremiobacteraeota bacterium]|nr:glycerol-3-phosphate 1-O-acyltransferase PlsY [Candidatus Eremiobacteraeota bacterium]
MRALPFAGLLAAYLLGSIPTAYLAGRLHGIDLRQHGSGNLGATNAVRVLGWRTGVPVFAIDAAKGYVPAALFWHWFGAHPHWSMAYGVAAIVGHVKPVFLIGHGGGGGKGVATAAGVFLGLAPVATLIAFLAFGVTLGASGYVSLASMVAALALVVALGVTAGVRAPVFPVGVFVAAFVIWSHRANIGRLRRGEESRMRRRCPVEAPVHPERVR